MLEGLTMYMATNPAAAGGCRKPMTIGDMTPLTEIVEAVVWEGACCKGDTCHPVHRSPQKIIIVGLRYSMGLMAIKAGEDEIGWQVLGTRNACATQGIGWPENLRRIVGVSVYSSMLVASGCRPVNGIIGSYRVGMAIQAEGIVIRGVGTLNLL